MSARIHPNAINLIAGHFGTHEAGLPEWVKNAREAYIRAGVSHRHERVIIINLLGSGRKGGSTGIECIDFVGISAEDIEANFLEWANPDAATQNAADASAFEGGQGNGGKAYGRQLFGEFRFMSVKDRQLSVVGFTDAEKFNLDFLNGSKGIWAEDRKAISGGVRAHANKILAEAGRPAGSNITIVRGTDPLRSEQLSVGKVEAMLQRSPQAREALRSCEVHIYVKGRPTRIVELQRPPAHPDFPESIKVPIPEVLEWEESRVPTVRPGFPAGELTINVAASRLRAGQWHGQSTFIVRARGVKSIGEIPTEELDLPNPQLRDHVYGEVLLPLLTDPKDSYEIQSRQRLKIGPLSSALKQFVSGKVAEILAEFDQKVTDKTKVKKKRKLESLHEQFAKWIETKLAGFDGLADEGEGEGTGKRSKERKEPKEHKDVASLRINRRELLVCMGTTYRLRAVGEDADGKPVPAGHVEWSSSDPKVCAVDANTGDLKPVSAGSCSVSCASPSTGLVALPVKIEVERAASIRLLNDEPVKVSPNRRTRVQAEVVLVGGRVVKDPVLNWEAQDSNIAQVTQDGVVVGQAPGETIVRASATDVESDPLQIEVRKGTHGEPDRQSSARPRILLSGVHKDPTTDMDVILEVSDPPVFQRPGLHDSRTNTWWINLQSPLAKAMYTHGPESIQWRNYHFQRFIDVYVRLEIYREYQDRQDLAADTIVYQYDDLMARIYRDAADEILGLVSDDKYEIEGEA